ncbi:putative HTH tetR-type domain-containing protein [Rubrivivax sp. A210]|uniref:TetR/AcrR family transcriptional regulator n=1 Tax=Rubrivivax sp. A210 TaxID=2772301 RepID=UPI0019195503|nr:TetR/AcrR family transcriptional regulator [Rubrivivax sp. A210]CAD5369659.1 putative HTH tetR-type domain-containing protein [Rubrivivax sp. A210]
MTRDALIQACAELIAEQGLAALSLRKVAERVGIQAPSIYTHFANKEALLSEASRRASAALGDCLRQACQGDDARERLLSTAMGYLHFADTQASLFALFFKELPSVRRSLEDLPDAGSPYGFLIDRVGDFLGGPREPVEVLAFGIWSLVHGAAVLRQTHLRGFSGPIVEGTRQNLARLLDGWHPLPPPEPATNRPPRKGNR